METDMADPNPFGAWLARQLKRRGWSPSDLAFEMEVEKSTVGRWLKGVRSPRPDMLQIMATALDINIDEVLSAAGYRQEGLDRVSPAVMRLQPLIDQIAWNEPTYQLVEQYLRLVRDAQRGMLQDAPRMLNEMDDTEGIRVTEFGDDDEDV